MNERRFHRRRGSKREELIRSKKLCIRLSTRRKSASDDSTLSVSDWLPKGAEYPDHDVSSEFAEFAAVEGSPVAPRCVFRCGIFERDCHHRCARIPLDFQPEQIQSATRRRSAGGIFTPANQCYPAESYYACRDLFA